MLIFRQLIRKILEMADAAVISWVNLKVYLYHGLSMSHFLEASAQII